LRERVRQLTIKAARLWQVDAPARLIVSATDAPADVDVVISGLATGTVLSLGKPIGPNGWRLSAKDLNSVMILPPRGFVGIMDLILELRLVNDSLVDRKGLLLEWSHNGAGAAAAFPPRQIEAAEIELMVKSGLEFMANGNIAAARMMFRPAAESGSAVAAFALAETYDPSVLKQLGAVGGITSDVSLANTWYEKARALGSPLARERLERLARVRE
jgi:TPR repeat protein